jgi:hypothetical protein
MNCYKHTNNGAIAVCCGCGRAICEECVIESKSNRLTCSTDCSIRASRVDDVLTLIIKKQNKSNLVGSWFLWLAGLGFFISGTVDFLHSRSYWPFPVGMSIVFLLGGYWYFTISKKDG